MAASVSPFTREIGRIITGRDVELAALAMLKRWSSTYLSEAERQAGRPAGSWPRIRTWTTTSEFEKWPEDQLPCVLLISPGLAGPPRPDGSGRYRAEFTMGLATIVSAARADETAALAKAYCAAFRTCLLQHQSLEGFGSGLTWLDENYDDLPSVDTRSLGAGQAIFAVEVDDISRRWNGPPYPDAPPPDPTDPIPPDPDVQTVVVGTRPEPI
jgi:hypothetical protein